MDSLGGYRLGDTFRFDDYRHIVCGFGKMGAGVVLFAAAVEDDEGVESISTGDDFYAFTESELPPNLGSRPVLEKMTKAQLIDVIMDKR
jgi:hypothetical protein